MVGWMEGFWIGVRLMLWIVFYIYAIEVTSSTVPSGVYVHLVCLCMREYDVKFYSI